MLQQGIQFMTHLFGIQDGPCCRIITRFKVLPSQFEALGIDGDFRKGFGKADHFPFQVIDFFLYLVAFSSICSNSI